MTRTIHLSVIDAALLGLLRCRPFTIAELENCLLPAAGRTVRDVLADLERRGLATLNAGNFWLTCRGLEVLRENLVVIWTTDRLTHS